MKKCKRKHIRYAGKNSDDSTSGFYMCINCDAMRNLTTYYDADYSNGKYDKKTFKEVHKY